MSTTRDDFNEALILIDRLVSIAKNHYPKYHSSDMIAQSLDLLKKYDKDSKLYT